jgi:hypothetical protein
MVFAKRWSGIIDIFYYDNMWSQKKQALSDHWEIIIGNKVPSERERTRGGEGGPTRYFTTQVVDPLLSLVPIIIL